MDRAPHWTAAPPADTTLRRVLAVPGRGLRDISTLPALLDDWHCLARVPRRAAEADAVLAWGLKPSAERAATLAQRLGLPLLRAEDGFLRSVGLGADAPPLSVVVDDVGLYYDAAHPSRLERLVAAGCDELAAGRAAALAAAWCAGRVSKYNHAREHGGLPPDAVLVVDQTAGDLSIRHGQADAGSFARMLEAALDEHPGAPLLLKVHPEVVAGRKRGHFGRLSPGAAARVTVVAGDVHAPALLAGARAVYVVTSQMGFEALLWGRPVRCFGMPFYAGWGLTDDALPAPARRAPARWPALVHAALVAYPRYLDPETGLRCEPERLLQWMALQRRMRERFPPVVHALGFSRWKKPIARAFLAGSELRFHPRDAEVPAGEAVAVWGRREVPGGASRPVLRLEDGFLRSVGLGADLVRPLSWVVDACGLYYDATGPSALEVLLLTVAFDDALRARARALRERLVSEGLSKYNVGHGRWAGAGGGRLVVLVPGQVETDASMAWGAPGLRGNLALLRAVRAARPDAHLLYKPHPDVVAGLRQGGGRLQDFAALCDEVVVDVPIAALLQQVDEVHVLTSLAGFEALLRGRRVVTWGQPFYAGWGLTGDQLPLPRRSRRLTLDELVAGVLLLYPTYVSRRTGHFTTAEAALDELLAWRAAGASRAPWRTRLLRPLLRLLSR